MTRFARAKGSKSSNERVPEKATSWGEMKQQLLDKNKEIEENKHREEAVSKREANYKAFLTEMEEKDTKNTKWASFPEVKKPDNKSVKNKKTMERKVKGAVGKLKESDNECKEDSDYIRKLQAEIQQVLANPEEMSDIDALPEENSHCDAPPEEASAKVNEVKVVKKPKQKKSLLKIVLNTEEKCAKDNVIQNNDEDIIMKESSLKFKKQIKEKRPNDDVIQNNDGKESLQNKPQEELTEKDLRLIEKKKQRKLRQNEKKRERALAKKAANGEPQELTEKDKKRIEKKKQKRLRQLEKRKLNKIEQEAAAANAGTEIETNSAGTLKPVPMKPIKTVTTPGKQKKLRDNENHTRKKPFVPNQMVINGKEVAVDYVDGFPVKKEDGERLKKLRGEMISKGLPRSEISHALKLERRKAEKAFSREKKKVCFNCRKSGHNLSECPELNKDQVAQSAGTGICFKCGSTEHTHFECKVVRGQEFRFAQCFICNEQGHIARQCPDNARGLYPKGGACNVCGDVTHLKKDCPKFQFQQYGQEKAVQVETFGGENPDDLDGKPKSSFGGGPAKIRPNKIVKF